MRSAEPTYVDFRRLWEDMGSPDYKNPHSVSPGHVICLSWDGSLHKFGIDRGGGVHSDYGNPDPFQFRFDFGEISGLATQSWTQALADGLPVVTTAIAKTGIRYGLEQFAYPLGGPPSGRSGDVPLVLFQKLFLENTSEEATKVTIRLHHEQEEGSNPGGNGDRKNTVLFLDAARNCLFCSPRSGGGCAHQPQSCPGQMQ